MVAERPVGPSPAAPGLVGDVGLCFHKMMEGMARLEKVADSVESDGINVERYVREIALTLRDVIAATGRMFEREPWRVTALISASGHGGAGPRSERQVRSVMGHRVIQSLKAVNGDKTLFRQWHQKVRHCDGSG